MLILRLGTSDDWRSTVAEHERGYHFVEQALAAETGEPVDTVVREIWPDERLLPHVEEWLDRYTPDMVSLKISSFWFTYLSVPLLFERRRLGRAVGRAGRAAVDHPAIAQGRLFRLARRAARGLTQGGAVYFTPDETIARMEAMIHAVVRREGPLLAVRGPLIAEVDGCSAATARRLEFARRRVDQRVARICSTLDVHYTGRYEAPPFASVLPFRGPDRLHQSALGHRRTGLEEARAHLAAWRHAHGASLPLYLDSDSVS